MKIAIIAHLNFPIGQPFHGGLEMHTHCLTSELMERGHEVTLFALATSDPSFNIIEPVLDAEHHRDGVDNYRNEPDFGSEFIRNFHAYNDIITQIQRGGFDVVHNNSLHYLPLSQAYTLGCAMVTTLHCPPFASQRNGVLLARHHPDNQFVAVSESVARQWRDDIGECRVILNGINIDHWQPTQRAQPNTAFWYGRFCLEKGPHYAIQAAKLAGYSLRLAGSIYDNEYFQREIEPLLDQQIVFVGHLDHAQINREVGSAAVGLFTSTWEEPFGLVLPEMLACGTPVMAFDSGAASEILDASCGIIVPKHDVAAMATAMPLAAKLSRADCYRRAADHFPVGRMISDYEQLYNELVSRTAYIDGL